MGLLDPRRLRRMSSRLIACGSLIAMGAVGLGLEIPATDTHVVIVQSVSGMHPMQSDYSQIMLFPPSVSIRAQVIRRGAEPRTSTTGLTATYRFVTNTHSSDKTNFWQFSQALLGVQPPPDVGLTGFGLSGAMARDSLHRGFAAASIPLTPFDDDGKESTYQIAHITVRNSLGVVIAETEASVPVSNELNCILCHDFSDNSVAAQVIEAHDRRDGTHLAGTGPVNCTSCHADASIGAPGQPGVSSLSKAMHGAHAIRMPFTDLENNCYACHPGVRTTALRDVHASAGLNCVSCHGTMFDLAMETRRPYVDEPRCANCHDRAGFQFEPAGVLFRDASGHGDVQCITCHGGPHAIGPATTQRDNMQAMRLQGEAGVLQDCTVCHINRPSDSFPHRPED